MSMEIRWVYKTASLGISIYLPTFKRERKHGLRFPASLPSFRTVFGNQMRWCDAWHWWCRIALSQTFSGLPLLPGPSGGGMTIDDMYFSSYPDSVNYRIAYCVLVTVRLPCVGAYVAMGAFRVSRRRSRTAWKPFRPTSSPTQVGWAYANNAFLYVGFWNMPFRV